MSLSAIQKSTICDVAREAWEAWDGRAEFTAAQPPGTEPFTAWRHQHQHAAVGLQSLTLCTQEHYGPLVRHFMQLRTANRAASSTLSLF
jgi:hypothetical protein